MPLQMSTLEQTLAGAGSAKCCEIVDITMTFTALPGVPSTFSCSLNMLNQYLRKTQQRKFSIRSPSSRSCDQPFLNLKTAKLGISLASSSKEMSIQQSHTQLTHFMTCQTNKKSMNNNLPFHLGFQSGQTQSFTSAY